MLVPTIELTSKVYEIDMSNDVFVNIIKIKMLINIKKPMLKILLRHYKLVPTSKLTSKV